MRDWTHRTVTCDECKTDFVTDVKTYVDGDLEITYFRCPECLRSYLVSVTDSSVRNNIEEHRRLSDMLTNERKKKKPDAELVASWLERMRNLREYNLTRSHSLKQKYTDRYRKGLYPWERSIFDDQTD
jgi:hypothetical protein